MTTHHEALRQTLTSGALPVATSVLAVVLLLVACGEEEAETRGARSNDRADNALDDGGGGGGPAKTKAKAGANAPATPVPVPPEDEEPVVPMGEVELPEAVFVETDENRDPFRSFLPVFTAQALPEEDFAPRPPVLLEDVSLDELRLIAVVSGEGGNPRAMVVDPDGKGWIVQRGDYVGRGERIRLGPGLPEREINWRVVRVRPDRIILVREDPVQAGPPVTQVMRLYPEDDSL
jgi:type IV pilus assembly protein PilP